MRCKNCGWPNKPGEFQCVKCGASLDAGVLEPSDGGYSPAVSDGRGYPDDSGLKKTVFENDVFGPSAAAPVESAPATGASVCPKCGYPLREGVGKCPNCNFISSGQGTMGYGGQPQQNHAPTTPIQRRPTKMDAGDVAEDSPAQQPTQPSGQQGVRHHASTQKFNGTINPYMMNIETEPLFVLKPLKRMNERNEPEAVELEGKEVILTRENTEPNNPSITSKEQALVRHENGKWFITDRSEQHTTFVCPSKPVELADGDIILLGNRLFEFHVQE